MPGIGPTMTQSGVTQRVEAARAHKAEVLERLSRRKKPPAPDLPTPP